MAAVTPVAALSGELVTSAQAGQRPAVRRSGQRRLNIFRYVTFTVFGLFFLLPLLAMVRFSLERATGSGGWSVAAWTTIPTYTIPDGPPLISGVEITLELAVLAGAVILLLVLPTMIWVHLKVRWLSRVLEFICLLPLTIPAIVLVVGLAPVYNKIEQYNVSALMLFFAYGILALPYVYRAFAAGLTAIDAATLSEAARSLGARWPTVMIRVIAPNMYQAILNALMLTVALVCGEFTIAYLLTYNTLPVDLFAISRNASNASVLFAGSAASLLFAFILLLILSYVGRRLRRDRA
jgi:putative spermidine/putrescine transport system permease protein